MLINKIIKNWFNGTPIYKSEKEDKEHHTKRQKKIFAPASRPGLQTAMLKTPTCVSFHLMGIFEEYLYPSLKQFMV